MRSKIAFVTCRELPNLTDDDRLAVAALAANGIEVEPAIWDDPDVDWTAYSVVVIRSTWDYHLKSQTFSAWLDLLDQVGALVWNSTKIVRWNMKKTYLRDLENKGANVIPSLLVPRGVQSSLSDLLATKGWEYVVVKPIISATAYKTALFQREQAVDFQDHFAKLLQNGGAIVQEFAEEVRTTGEWSLIFFDKRYSHSMLKRPKSGDFRVQTEWGGEELKATASPQLIEQVQKIVDLVEGRLLYARVDGIDRGGRLHLMELELIEPHLFFGFEDGAPDRFVATLSEFITVKE